MICICARSDVILPCLNFVMSWPSKTMLPEVGSVNFKIVRPAVVLPQPDSPTSPRVSPAFKSNEMPSTALTTDFLRSLDFLTGKCLVKLVMLRIVSLLTSAPPSLRPQRMLGALTHRCDSEMYGLHLHQPGQASELHMRCYLQI